MTLHADLVARIRKQGPLTLAEYMQECLFHPTFGYYTTQDIFGAAGDFVTAPEISQMFGELIGLALVQAWIDQGRPSCFTLAELGPGRGTLMADILRVGARAEGFLNAAQVTLVETSPRLQAIQRSTLSDVEATWVETVSDLQAQPLFLVANEFFDALPVRQFQRAGPAWQERHVGVEADTLVLGLAPGAPHMALSHRLDDTADGDIVEVAPQMPAICGEISDLIRAHGGVAYIIDYGDWRSLGDTLQAVRQHTYVPVLETPGQADLTAHVDFEALSSAATCAFSKLTPQGVLLERLGITARAQALADRLSGSALDAHIAAHRRLTHPDEMGNLFKVLGLFPSGMPPPPGLDA